MTTSQHITLEQFTDILKYIDRETGFEEYGMFCCKPEQIEPDAFQYLFNGHMTSGLKFYSDGRVLDIQQAWDDNFKEKDGHLFKNINNYLNNVIYYNKGYHDPLEYNPEL